MNSGYKLSSSSKSLAVGKTNPARPSLKESSIRGVVVHGNHLGSTLGFPTANIIPPEDHPPVIPNGVYLVSVMLREKEFFGLCNIGYRPTIGGTHIVIEVNILDFSDDIYGEEISIRVIKAIRKEKKFKDLEQLVNQIKLDKSKAVKFLSALNKNE